MSLGTDVGHIVSDGDPPPPTESGTSAPTFVVYGRNEAAHVYCGQMVGWIRILLDTEVGLSPGDIVLDGEGRSSFMQFPPVSTWFLCMC